MFRVGIPPKKILLQEDIIIIIIISERKLKKIKKNKRGCSGVIPTLNMLMFFMNRKEFN